MAIYWKVHQTRKREEVEGGGLEQYETVENMSLEFPNDILHPVFVELVKIYKVCSSKSLLERVVLTM